MEEAEQFRIAEAAAQLPEDEQHAFIFEACNGDEEAIAEIIDFLEFSPPDDFFPDEERNGLELVGREINGLKLVDQIGEGGCGIVYEACRVEDPRPMFAVKVLREEFVGRTDVLRRFSSEQQLLRRMKHPNIAALIGSGTLEDRPYFVMELIRNSLTIIHYCKISACSLEERLRLFENICDAVAHAHQQGIIHRDIKPSNVLVDVSSVTAVPTLKLIDFGIAKLLDPDENGAITHTGHGQFVGTRFYASPEQIQGNPADTRTDIYGLGLILFELLTGHPAIDASSRPDASELARMICDEPTRPPTELAAAKGIDTIPRAMDWIVRKALEKRPSQRYETVHALVSDVRNYRLGKPIQAQPQSAWYSALCFVREHRLVTGLICLLFVASSLATWFGYRTAVSEQEARNESQVKSEALRQLSEANAKSAANLRKAEIINGALVKVITPGEVRDLDDLNLSHREKLRRAAGEIHNSVDSDPLVEASISSMLGISFMSYGDVGLGVNEHRKAVELYGRERGESHADTMKAKYYLANALRQQYDLEEALTIARSVLRDQRVVLGTSHPETIRTTILVAGICRDTGRYQEGLDVLGTIEIEPQTGSKAYDDVLMALKVDRAEDLRQMGLNTKAEQELKEVIRYREATVGPSDISTIAAQHSLAKLYLSTKRAALAESLLRDAVAKANHNQRNLVITAALYRDLGGAVKWQDRDDEAEKLILQALELEQQILGEGRPANPGTWYHYARLLRDREDFAEAEAITRYALAVQTKEGATSLGMCGPFETLSSLYEDQHRHGPELYWKTRVYMIYARHFGWTHANAKAFGTRAVEALVNFSLKIMAYGYSAVLETAIDFLDVESKPGEFPFVIKNGGELSLQWRSQP